MLALAVLVASASLVAVPLVATPADAAQSAKCTKLTTKTVGTKITATVSNCTPTKATGGKGTGTFTSTGAPSGTLNITLKWALNKGTTKANIKFANQATKRGRPTGSTRVKITGKVTGGSGVAFKTIKKGEPVTGSVCNHPTKGITLEPGTGGIKF